MKKYFKLFLFYNLFYLGILNLILFIWKRTKRNYPALILFFHRFKKDDEKALPERFNIKYFRSQMAYIKKKYNVISLDELIENLKGRKGFRQPSIVITIDDGFRDNYTLVFPILRELELPCTIFLASGYMGTEKAPWVDEIGYSLQDCRQNTFLFPELFGEEVIPIGDHEQKANAWNRIYEKMLYLEQEVRVGFVEELLRRLREEGGGERGRDRVMLNWAEVDEMRGNGVSFGAHTLSHPTLSKMPLEQGVYEIVESKRIIERELGIRVRHFAIPNGKDVDFTEDLRDFCKKEGFESIVTTNFGLVKKGSNPYNLPRICFENRLFLFSSELARLFIIGK